MLNTLANSASASSYAKAETANRDIDKLMKAGIAASNAAMQKISSSALQIYLRDDSVDVANVFATSLMPIVAKTMALANLMGQRRSLLDIGLSVKELVDLSSAPISLDRFSEIRRMLEHKGLLQELDKLQKGMARELYSDLYQIGSKVDAKMRFAVAQVVAKGLSKRKALAAIKNALSKIGYDKSNPYQIKTLYETAVTRAYGKGRWDRDHSAKVWGLFWGYEYVTMRDDRVRPAHRVLDGTTLPKNDPFWRTYWPPNGWNCRCIVVKIMKRRKQWQPTNPPPPDKGFENKNFTDQYNPLNLSNVNGLSLDRGCCNAIG